MKSKRRRRSTSAAEVTRISAQGLHLLVAGREYFLPYREHPWFEGARASKLRRVQVYHGRHLRWPLLDVDLELDALNRPKQYPLTDTVRSVPAPRRRSAGRAAR